MKTILAVTGTRADYGIYRPVFGMLRQSGAVDLALAVTAMHLCPAFGHTIDAIERDGFRIAARLHTLTTEDTPRAIAAFVGRTTEKFVPVLADHRPDLLLVLGDRGEQLAAAVAATYLRVPIAHLHGGEESGTIDNVARHAITQLATIHLTTAEVHAKRVRDMRGQDAEHVYVVGAPGLDAIRSLDAIPKETLCKSADFDPTLPIVLVVQHPDTTDSRSPDEQLTPVVEALFAFRGNVLVVGANADAGGMRMNQMLREFAAKRPCTQFRITMPHREFLSWEKHADVLVGNSSSGIIEAASFGLPVVNVGNRQHGRLRSGNVLDVPYHADSVAMALREALSRAFHAKARSCQNVYGDGNAAGRIVKILETYLS